MGTFTAPKNGRSHQSKSHQGKNKVLKTGAGMMGSAPAPSSNDVVSRKKGAAWSLSKNKSKAC